MDMGTSNNSTRKYGGTPIHLRCQCCGHSQLLPRLAIAETYHVGTQTPPGLHLLCETCRQVMSLIEQDWKSGQDTIDSIHQFLTEWWVAREG